ncbi:MAG: hypothetical protein DMG31_20335 [Acidobacteria bacterium]|nr:MAG: hypothetical protein DMG31_20335 [Acidobacteriota bacterium]
MFLLNICQRNSVISARRSGFSDGMIYSVRIECQDDRFRPRQFLPAKRLSAALTIAAGARAKREHGEAVPALAIARAFASIDEIREILCGAEANRLRLLRAALAQRCSACTVGG